MVTYNVFMNILFSLYSFASEFWEFLGSSLNDFFDVDLGSVGDVTGLQMFFGAGIVVILGIFLVNLLIPN